MPAFNARELSFLSNMKTESVNHARVSELKEPNKKSKGAKEPSKKCKDAVITSSKKQEKESKKKEDTRTPKNLFYPKQGPFFVKLTRMLRRIWIPSSTDSSRTALQWGTTVLLRRTTMCSLC